MCRNWVKKTTIGITLFSLLGLFVDALLRILICDSFIVSGPSMEPTFHDRQRVWASKTGIGARIYTKYDFSDSELHSLRMPGFGKMRKGDIVVFNHPYGAYPDKISFKINYVLIKRCVGAPGDTVKVSGSEQYFVPGRGDYITLDTCMMRQYRHQIEFETGKRISVNDKGIVFLDGKILNEYQFTSDWYFFVGDNPTISIDSRQFGLVPESYIIGRVIACSAPDDT